MSPKAILRRQCKRAMWQLISRFGYTKDDFEIPESEWNEHDVLPGTPIYWWRCSYEYEESDCCTALDQFRSVAAANAVDWAKVSREDNFRERHKLMREHPEWFRLGGKYAEVKA